MSQTNPALATQLDAELVRQAMSLIAPARRIAFAELHEHRVDGAAQQQAR